MGIYPTRGIEYRIYDYNSFTVLNIKDLDKRLESSQYYLRQKDIYLQQSFPNDFVTCKLTEHDIKDIILIYEENQKILNKKRALRGNILDEGFFDVYKIWCSL